MRTLKIISFLEKLEKTGIDIVQICIFTSANVKPYYCFRSLLDKTFTEDDFFRIGWPTLKRQATQESAPFPDINKCEYCDIYVFSNDLIKYNPSLDSLKHVGSDALFNIYYMRFDYENT